MRLPMRLIVFLVILLVTSSLIFAEDDCKNLLSNISGPIDGTEDFVGYLGRLLETDVIGESELVAFINGLHNSVILNPIPKELEATSSAVLVHRGEVETYINKTHLDQGSLLEWAKKSLRASQQMRVSKQAARQDTANADQLIEFVTITPPTPRVNGPKSALTHRFEFMTTPVTQKQWVEIMGENPSHFKDGPESAILTIDSKPHRMLPNNPVEKISWWSAAVFANRLSVKAGLKPVYDFSGISFKPGTTAESGTLEVTTKINMRINVLDTEGYRLPLEVETEFILETGRSKAGEFFFGKDTNELEAYGWYKKNSDKRTHPVAQLKPLLISGQAIYDVVGNVYQWQHDEVQPALAGASALNARIVRSGCFTSVHQQLRSDFRKDIDPNERNQYSGFRLVRTVK